ncbi:AtpZ/AtpI family protein [Flectobacillus major]|uniref:AtpZ/AtpI family protein n=1 Tax=Flectobacillus major TaxID=103 RepID=UPI0004199329|nr:AtpZ/AtpI family protein [Flectobacillus major]
MKDETPNSNKYMRYMGAGTQMLVTIAGGVFLGNWLDKTFHTTTPWYSISCSLIFICAAIYLLIRSLPKE